MNHEKLKNLFHEYIDNIDSWLELDDEVMIEERLKEISIILNNNSVKHATSFTDQLCEHVFITSPIDSRFNFCVKCHVTELK
jgi:hypothetical protein